MRAVLFITLLFVVRALTSKATLQHISDKVVTHIKTLKDKAATTIHRLAADVDLKKLEQLDLLNLLAKKLVKKPAKPEPLFIDPYQVNRLKYYFEHTHGAKKAVITPVIPHVIPPVVPHVIPHKHYGVPH